MDIIDINPEDLEEPEEPEKRRPEGEEDLLVIEAEDLEEPLPVAGGGGAYPPAGGYPARGGYPPGPGYAPAGGAGFRPTGGTLGLAQVARWGPLQMALAGAIGGFVAWMISEPFIDDRQTGGELLPVLIRMAGFGGLLGGLIGAALGSVEGLVSGALSKAGRGALWGLVIGGGGGVLGGIFGQLLFGAVVQGQQTPFVLLMFIRTLAWALVGLGIGLGQGMHQPSPRKLMNGMIGGVLGGGIGGFLFDPLGLLLGLLGFDTGLLSRLVGMTVTGFFAGAAIGLVEELRKEAWVIIAQGPLAGKQFILYRPVTTIGSSPEADICLIKDKAVRPQHAVLQQVGQEHVLLASPEAPVAVNGVPTSRQRLASGDTISVGNTLIEYHLRALPPLPAGYGRG